jgi:hypothetical protein
MVEPFYTCNTMYCKEEGRASVFLVVDWNLYLHRGACKFMMTSAAPAPLTLSAAKRGLCFSSVGTVVRSAESSCNEVRPIANFSMHFSWNDGGGSRRPCPVACIAVLPTLTGASAVKRDPAVSLKRDPTQAWGRGRKEKRVERMQRVCINYGAADRQIH